MSLLGLNDSLHGSSITDTQTLPEPLFPWHTLILQSVWGLNSKLCQGWSGFNFEVPYNAVMQCNTVMQCITQRLVTCDELKIVQCTEDGVEVLTVISPY